MKLANLMLAVLATMTLITSCGNGRGNNLRVAIETPYGTMKVKLYDDTPLHRDNFIKLVRDGAYDSLLFHRVIRGFMIQGGDPDSRHATPTQKLGESSIGADIPAEIVFPAHFHRRGALAAAREPDSVNPERKSSGSQFYIVQGERQTDEYIGETETRHNNKVRVSLYPEIMKFYSDSLQQLQNQGKALEMSEMQLRVVQKVEEVAQARGLFLHYTDEIRKVYQEEGGTPHLDSEYTVFGEVYEGLDIIDSIASVAVMPPAMRPANDVWMVMREIND